MIVNILFFALGVFSTLYLMSRRGKKIKGRMGIYNQTITATNGGSRMGTQSEIFEAQIEVVEIAKTRDKSKLKTINITVDQTKFSTDSQKRQIRELVDNTWVESSKIEWIENAQEDIRDKKIREILK